MPASAPLYTDPPALRTARPPRTAGSGSKPRAKPRQLAELQQALPYAFKDEALLQRALTHRSHNASHYERLEFLGDAVLNLIVADLLHHKLPEADEGSLSRIRAKLVREDTLHRIALSLKLPEYLRLGEGEAKSGGAKRPSILADALEALVGALYSDAGLAATQQLVGPWFDGVDLHDDNPAAQKDAKTLLQELLQSVRKPLPQYELVGVTGPQHQQVFEMECVLYDGQRARGLGKSRRTAEQTAATAMIAQLGIDPHSLDTKIEASLNHKLEQKSTVV